MEELLPGVAVTAYPDTPQQLRSVLEACSNYTVVLFTSKIPDNVTVVGFLINSGSEIRMITDSALSSYE